MHAVIKVSQQRESICIISVAVVVVVRGGGGGPTQRDRRQPWFGREPVEGLWLIECGGTRGREGEREKRGD